MNREVICADAIEWMQGRSSLEGCSVVTSLPDVSEAVLSPVVTKPSIDAWKEWFIDAARRAIRLVPNDGFAIFYQTDIKHAGTWVDKGHWVQTAADAENAALIWHKIVCRLPAGAISFGRPAYAHLLCFSKAPQAAMGKAFADVIIEPGKMTWPRAIPLTVCQIACDWVRRMSPSTRTIVDPFCGVGTVLAVANASGLGALGVDTSIKRCRRAKTLELPRAGD